MKFIDGEFHMVADLFNQAGKQAPAEPECLTEIKDLSRYLIAAVMAHSFDKTKAALEAGADPNFQDEDGMTALHHAAASNSRKCLRLLIKSGRCDFSLKDNDGCYASDLAIEWGNDQAVYRLLYLKRMKQSSQRDTHPQP